jgi:hypothetical protein
VPKRRTRWDEDNEMPLNAGAFIAVGAVVLALVGLAALLALT